MTRAPHPRTSGCWLRIGALLALGALLPSRSTAADVYILRFFLTSFPSCFGTLWQDDIVFHNSTSQDLTVRILGISNGPLADSAVNLQVPAGRTTTATGKVNWRPQGGYQPIWVVHLDVPDGIVFQSRAEGFSTLCTGGAPPSPTPDRGTFPLPVARSLTPVSVSRIFLGTDLGSDPSHVNVGIYNAGSQTADALIEMRQGCDESVIARRTVQIPTNTVIQIGGFGSSTNSCPSSFDPTSPWTRYVAITVNQPSFSYVINRLDDLNINKIPYLVPITQD